jgi:phage/plasmid-associated DNA primase
MLSNYSKNLKVNLFELYDEFSKKSKKYDAKKVKEVYDYFEYYECKINIGTLFFYAKMSNIIKYNEVMDRIKKNNILIDEIYLANKIKELNGEYFIFKNKIFYCFDIETNLWYENNDNVMYKYIGNVLSEYIKDFDVEIYKKCRLGFFQEKILKQYKIQFALSHICDENFDEKKHLIGFNNGVYDLQKNEFRQYRFNDYITMTTGYNYKQGNEEDKKEILKIFNQIEPSQEKFNLLLQILANGLIGKSPQRFIIFSGCGGNGKSLINSMMEKVLGNFYYKANINTLCEKKLSETDQSIANMNKKRYVIFTEPEETQKINNGIMKDLTDGANINARGIYEKNTTQKINAIFILECNKKIKLKSPATDGEIRRVTDFNFTKKFVDKNNSDLVDNKDVFLRNDKYKEAEFLNKIKHSFFEILAEKANHFLNNDEHFNIPKEVQEKTNEYINTSYVLLDVLNELCDKSEKENFISLSDFYDNMKMTDFYLNLSKAEKRDLTKKKIIDFFETNRETAVFYKNRYQPYIDGEQKNFNNVLVGYKFK